MNKCKMDFDIILFDLDGTLTDSAEGIVNCVQHSAEKMGIPKPDGNDLKAFVGPPLDAMYKSYFGFEGEEVKRAIQFYRERYAEKGLFENKVYEGIPQLLESLKNKGKILCVATSKPELFSIQIIEHFKLDRFFKFVGGATFDDARNTKSKVIAHVIENMTIEKKEKVVMIGDRYYDIEGAKEMGIASIGVLYGYGDREEMEKAGADYIAESVEELIEMLV